MAARHYVLGVRALCSDGSKSPLQKISIGTAVCTLPTSTTQTVNNSTVKINVNLSCPADTIRYRYSAVGGTWIKSYVVNTTHIILSGLNPGVKYIYQLSTCPKVFNSWTPTDTIDLSRPNFLIILLDDARYDSYGCNGGPSWFLSPNIDRIANEGVNFKNNFAVFSYCTPGRATIMTGLYPHKNGAIDNSHAIYPDLPTLSTILDQSGYNTAMIGKYFLEPPQPGFDYWLFAEPEYVDAKYNYNGDFKIIPGHNTDVLTDSALAFLDKNQGPFYMWLAYHAPHDSAIAQPQFQGIYAGDPMPIPDNTDPYTINFPSFLEHLPPHGYLTLPEIAPAYERYYETLAGIDQAVGAVLNKLEALNILDNTMVIFTSDNGSLFGEHSLYEKRFAYDPSMRVPLFIRYPSWFADNTIVESDMALNIDIAPTILDAAGIEDTFNFDGVSLKNIAEGSIGRKDMLYENLYRLSGAYVFPYIRAVRSFQYKYIFYGCNNGPVEEFFDLVNDPEENVNLINNSAYDSIIEVYKNRLIELQQQYEDTFYQSTVKCRLAHPQISKVGTASISADFMIYPNPSNGLFKIGDSRSNEISEVLSPLGIPVARNIAGNGNGEFDLRFLPSGMYFLVYEEGNARHVTKAIIE